MNSWALALLFLPLLLSWLLGLFSRRMLPGDGIVLDGGSGYGTFGCIVRQGRERFILTAAHVLEGAEPGQRVRRFDVPRLRPERVIGSFEPLKREVMNALDCAIVKPRFGARIGSSFPREFEPICDEPFPMKDLRFVHGVMVHDHAKAVRAVGAKTPRMVGGASCEAYARLKVDQLEFEPPLIVIKSDYSNETDFCAGGDSGALVLTMAEPEFPARPLGLLVARLKTEQIGWFGLAIPIERILPQIGKGAKIDSGAGNHTDNAHLSGRLRLIRLQRRKTGVE
jgi:hypothetical protein